MTSLSEIARALGGKINGQEAICHCPAHDDRTPSLSIKQTAEGKLLVKCRAGCTQDAVIAALEARGLWPKHRPNGKAKEVRRMTFDFRDPHTGKTAYRKIRIEYEDGDKTLFFEPKGRGGSAPLLYGSEKLADIGEGQPVWIVEGEKKVHRLRGLGQVAVSGDTGDSSKWLPAYAELLRGLDIILWPDSDDPGEKYIAAAARCLNGHAASLRVVRPFGLPNGAKGRDVCDWDGDAAALAKLAASAEPYAPFVEPSSAPADGKSILLPIETVEMEIIQWLWKHWLAKGKFHILAGAPEAGKTTIGLSIAACVSSGNYWPDGTKAEACNVLIWTGEDDIADTIKPRLVQMGADVTRIKVVAKQRLPDGKERPFSPASDMPSLAEATRAIPGGVGFLMIDPIVAAIGTKTDSHRNAETRCALQPVIDFAKETNCAVLGITHLTKGTVGKEPTERVTGSLAFGAVARVVMLAAKKQIDEEGAPPRILTRSKSNIGPSGGGFGYDIKASPLLDRQDIIATQIKWLDAVEGTARELLAEAEAEEDKEAALSKAEKAERFLKAALARGERPQKEIEAAAALEGISFRTLVRAARGLVHKRKDGMTGAWFWSL